METNINRTVKHALLIEPDDLSRIVQLIENEYGTGAFAAQCSEGSTLKTTEVVEILHYENPGFRRIESMGMAFGTTYQEGCSLKIEEGAFSGTASFQIWDSNDKRALRTATELESRLLQSRPSYSFLTRISLSTIIAIGAIAVSSIVVWRNAIATGRPPKAMDIDFLSALYLLAPFALVYVAAVMWLEKGWKWIFPKVAFTIGKQDAENQKRVKARAFFFVVLGVGIALEVFGNFVWDAVTKR